jgi:hypothetical protein
VSIEGQGAADGEGCGSCHGDTHGSAHGLYAGLGAFGTEDAASRMFETRVECEACHTGRSDGGSPAAIAADRAHAGSPHSAFATAGNVDCIHCHGPGFDGMLGQWQASITGHLAHVAPMLDELEQHLRGTKGHPAEALYQEARANVDLVLSDGSRGAHNIDYALDALAAGAERIDRARELLGLDGDVRATGGFPFRSELGCSTCHLGVEHTEATANTGQIFPHEPHVFGASLDCDACHSVENHGEPAPAQPDCTSCHHQEGGTPDAWDCATCHEAQESLLRGDVPGLVESPGTMSDMECTECHGDPPTIVRPGPQLCVLCHEAGYDRMQGHWQTAVAEQLDRLQSQLSEAERQVSESTDDPASALVLEARRYVDFVARDGSLGVHNVTCALDVLQHGARLVDEARALLGTSLETPASETFPFRSKLGCSTCHVAVDSPTATGSFSHGAHIRTVGLDCDACHSVEDHGEPSISRAECARCHHEESDDFEYWNCTSCHTNQRGFQLGSPEDWGGTPDAMAEMECADCHGEPPSMLRPTPRMCVLCHEDGYDVMQVEWQQTTTALLDELEAAIDAADDDSSTGTAVSRAREALETVQRDGSRGVHNFEFAKRLLEDALGRLRND